MTELNNCPGDIRSYYFWLRDHGGNTIDTAYAITYYYTTAETIAGATVDNTHWVDDTDFERQFAATIYIPNVKHYLNVQKLDDNNDPVNGVTFALYKKDDLLVTDTTWSVIESATPYDTVTTAQTARRRSRPRAKCSPRANTTSLRTARLWATRSTPRLSPSLWMTSMA